jgi:hypothetical protein
MWPPLTFPFSIGFLIGESPPPKFLNFSSLIHIMDMLVEIESLLSISDRRWVNEEWIKDRKIWLCPDSDESHSWGQARMVKGVVSTVDGVL